MPRALECGGCTVCCHVLPHGELNKPVFTDCPNADPGGAGCKIYDNRPAECADPGGDAGFLCAWARGDIHKRFKPSDIGGYIGSLYGDRITVYGVGGTVPQSLVDIANDESEKNLRAEVHVHHSGGVTIYRNGEVVAKPKHRPIPVFEVKT